MSDFESFAHGPSGGWKKQWFAGLALAAWPLIYGLICLHRGRITMFGRGGSMELKGPEAFWWALLFVGVGLFLHFHYFWGLSDRLWDYGQKLKIGAVLLMVISMAMTLYHLIWLRF